MKKKTINITVLYTLFASFSIIINILAQVLSVWVYVGQFYIEVSILIGTATGLPLRYILEKKYIFAFKSKNLIHDSKLFFIYTLMSVFTTLIFWITEYSFHFIFDTDTMRYFGGIIGLGIGFYIKYHLDKKFVFVTPNNKIVI